jgi:hypothetical protein
MNESLLKNQVTVEHKDGDVTKIFVVKKMSPWDFMLTTLALSKLITKSSSGIPASTVKQMLHDFLGTGVRVDDAIPMNGITNGKLVDISFDLILQGIENISEKELNDLCVRVIPNITYMNGQMPIQLNCDNNDRNWNNYIQSGMTMFMLLKDALQLEYAGFFPKVAKS